MFTVGPVMDPQWWTYRLGERPANMSRDQKRETSNSEKPKLDSGLCTRADWTRARLGTKSLFSQHAQTAAMRFWPWPLNGHNRTESHRERHTEKIILFR